MPDSLKPYTTVIPANARTRRGFLTVHQVGDRVYIEIPRALLQTDMLLMVHERGWDEKTIRWERVKDRILLRRPPIFSPDDSAYAVWLTAGSPQRVAPIAAQFPIETFGPDSAPVIDVTRLFISDVLAFGLGTFDERRSFIERVEAYPDHVFITATMTKTTESKNPPSGSTRIFWNVVRLPSTPMRPRLFDKRAGFFNATTSDSALGFDLGKDQTTGYIRRWRLEKKDPTARVSDPVQPIVFYLDPAMPAKWRPWVKAGVEAWQPALEAAGFRRAILALDPPNDSTWSPYDFRHSMVFWREWPSYEDRRDGGASANDVLDRRTGEILRADVTGIGTPIVTWVRGLYLTWAGALDPRAQHLPLPDSLEGALLQFVVSHEVGHALGLQDGNYGKFAYPVDSLRSRSWLRRMGFTPSVMNYSRFNYVAQPSDSIPPADLFQRVGPADYYSMMWGYTPIPEARTPADERATFEQWARIQDTIPWYRFVGNGGEHYGPYTGDAVDDDAPVRSTGFGLQNLRRVMHTLPSTTLRPGGNNKDLPDYYHEALELWYREQLRVVALIGGMTIRYKSGEQAGPVYTPLPASRQREAMQFLDSTVFRTPRWLVEVDLMRRSEPAEHITRLVGLQSRVLQALFEDDRIARLVDVEVAATDRSPVYALSNLLADVRHGIWTELTQLRPTIDAYRQGLQQAHILLLADRVKMPETRGGPRTLPAYERAVFRAELTTLRGEIMGAIPRAADEVTRAHLQNAKDLLTRALGPTESLPVSR